MRISIRLAIAISVLSAAPSIADGPWTMDDSNAVAVAAIDAAASIDGRSSFQFVELARALIKAGNSVQARVVLAKASSVLGPPVDNAVDRDNIVQMLAQLGYAADADALIGNDAEPGMKIRLLGKLGAGRARAGDIAAAQKAAAMVISTAETSATVHPVFASSALVEIGIALSEAGAQAEAVRLAEPMPAGVPKMRIIVQVAQALRVAATNRTGNPLQLQNVTDKVTAAARLAVSADKGPDQSSIIFLAAETIAECNGAAPARKLVSETVPADKAAELLTRLSDRLTARQEFDLARSLAPPPDPTSVESLLEAARRLTKQGDRAAAKRVALAASQLGLSVRHDPAAPPLTWMRHTRDLASTSEVLAELGAYDDAVATLQPIEMQYRSHAYISIIKAEIRNKDAAAISGTLPAAIAAIKLSIPPGSTTQLLYDLTKALAVGGFREQANNVYQSLLEWSLGQSDKPAGRLLPQQLAVLKADMGDLAGALATANDAGALVTKPGAADFFVAAVTEFGLRNEKLTEAEALAAVSRLKAAIPPLVAGPKATALGAIVAELAEQGNIQAARQVAAGLEAEPRDVLQSRRDTALGAIAKAQEKAGDWRGSFATTLQISRPGWRWPLLLRLAAKPVKP
jgi:hypothetical protein